MENTANTSARILASLLWQHGVRDVVVSPGSRNAPLLVAVDAHPGLRVHTVVDERSAAFVALGISVAGGMCPVAAICTSGTAPLNYAPALAEAYYRGVPLVAVTADRPVQWIDQDDSQTIRQPGIFSNFTKGTYDIDTESDSPDRLWMVDRLVNDALNMATSPKQGPVHINVRLADPLGATVPADPDNCFDEWRMISRFQPEVPCMPSSHAQTEALAKRLAPPAKVLVVAGFMAPACLESLLSDLSRRPNIVVMHEAQSNLHGYGAFIPNIDATLRTASADDLERFAPDIVVTLGGAITSRMLKTWLRRLPRLSHWSIGEADHAPDCFRRMEVQLPYGAWGVLSALVPLVPKHKNSESTAFKEFWLAAYARGMAEAAEFALDAPWSDFKAMAHIIGRFPKGWHLHLSNGTSVRYAQLFDYSAAASVECNRGVSGIDGCTSTAVGASVVNSAPTVLVTGDMSMQYDMGALAIGFIPPRLKIVVLNNGGGGIFRFIRSTRRLDSLERCFAGPVCLPVDKLAKAFGFKYLLAADETQLEKNYNKFISISSSPAILEVRTDGAVSAEILTKFFEKANV